MGKKVELEGYIYLRINEYDQYAVVEPCLDADKNVFFKNLDENSWKWSYYEGIHAKHYLTEKPKVKVKDSTYLAKILEDKLNIKPEELKSDYSNGQYLYTFDPSRKKVKITIEEIE